MLGKMRGRAFLASAVTASMAAPVQMKLDNAMQARGVSTAAALILLLAARRHIRRDEARE